MYEDERTIIETVNTTGMLELKGTESDRRKQVLLLRIAAIFAALCFLLLPVGYDMVEEALPLSILFTVMSAGTLLTLSFYLSNESRKDSMPLFMDSGKIVHVRCPIIGECTVVETEMADIERIGTFKDSFQGMQAHTGMMPLRLMAWKRDGKSIDLGVRQRDDLIKAVEIFDELKIRVDNRGELEDQILPD